MIAYLVWSEGLRGFLKVKERPNLWSWTYLRGAVIKRKILEIFIRFHLSRSRWVFSKIRVTFHDQGEDFKTSVMIFRSWCRFSRLRFFSFADYFLRFSWALRKIEVLFIDHFLALGCIFKDIDRSLFWGQGTLSDDYLNFSQALLQLLPRHPSKN